MNKYKQGQEVIFQKVQDRYLMGTVGRIVDVHKPDPKGEYYYYTVFGDLYKDEHFVPEYAIRAFPELGNWDGITALTKWKKPECKEK